MYELAGVLLVFGIVIVVCGLLLARFDKMPLEHAIYLAFITAFTVGFGDLAPKGRGARVITVILAFIGIVLVGILVAVGVRTLDIVFGSGP